MAPPPDGPVLEPQDSDYASNYNPSYNFVATDFENTDYEISYSKNIVTFVAPKQKSDTLSCAGNAVGIGEKIRQKIKSILSKPSTACSIYDFATDKIINLCTDDRNYRELALIPQKIGSNYIEATWEAGIVNTTRCNWIVLRTQSLNLALNLAKQIADYSKQGAVSIRQAAGTGAVVSYAYYSSHVVPASSAVAPHLLNASKCGGLFVGTALLSLAMPYGIAKLQHQDAQFPLEFQTFSDHTSALVVNPKLLEPSIRHYKRKKILNPRRKATLKPSVIDHFNCIKTSDFSFTVKPVLSPTLQSWSKMLPKQSTRKNIKLPKSGLYDQSLFHDHCAVPTVCLGG